eukprot:c46665_g1_i1 orf=132-299(+)
MIEKMKVRKNFKRWGCRIYSREYSEVKCSSIVKDLRGPHNFGAGIVITLSQEVLD